MADAPKPPNLVLLLADDLGYGDLGATGSRQIPTPHIDALAASGVHFTHAYVSSSVCAPSRAGMMTGKHQASFGFHAYATGPMVPPSTKAPSNNTCRLSSLPSGNQFTFIHPQGSLADDLSASYRWSTDLVTFHAGGASIGGTSVAFSTDPNPPVAETPTTVTVTVTATVNGTPVNRLFVDVEVTPK